MKQIKLTIILMGSALICFAQTKDEAAIRKTVETEIKDFHTNPDRKMIYGNSWELRPETRWVSTNIEGNLLFLTGDDIKKAIVGNFIPPLDSATFIFSNLVVKGDGKIGWAIFDDKTVYQDGKTAYFHQFRLLQKIGGTWKIISGGLHQYKPQ